LDLQYRDVRLHGARGRNERLKRNAMNLPRRRFLNLAAGAAALSVALATLLGQNAWSETTRTIRIVVPFPPGGSADILARLLGEQINKANGPTVVVENRPGGGASIAYEAVARGAPDGNTLVINGNSLVINPHLRKVNYDPLTSFEPVCYLLSSPNLIVVNSSSPYRTLDDYVAAARAKPGELAFAAVGPATAQHIGFEQFRRLAGIDVTFVPYPGGAPAITALLGGHVSAALANYSEALEHLNADKLRALVSLSRERIAPLPDVPSTAEVGFADYQVEIWFGVLAPANTPKNMAAQLAAWFKAAMQAPDVKPKLANLGLYPVGICLDDFAAYIRKQYDEYGRIIHEANIKPE
jgi:tripartite-type tricarboxylate transporter receptor subunit TctC